MAAPRRISPSLSESSPVGRPHWLGAVGALSMLLLAGAARAQEPEPASATGVSVHITAPRPLNERGEWQPPDSEQGFLSTTPVLCTAEVQGTEAPPPIHWRVTIFRGGRSAGTLTGSGPSLSFRPSDASPLRCTGPLAVEITATADHEQPTAHDASQTTRNPQSAIHNPQTEDHVRLEQDEIDQLRQEYLDMPGRKLELVPRREFIDRAAFERLGELSIPWPGLNRTERRGGGAYGHILLSDALREGLRQWQERLGSRGLTVSSGYRNPFKQSITNRSRRGREGAPGSLHQYGRAVDVEASLRRDFRDWVNVAWAALDARADYVETAPEGGWSHVHADWRHDGQGPPLTVKLEIAGRVVDADGRPVPTARVLGASDALRGSAGMPAWEGPDEEGRFTLRTVWRAGRPYRLRASAEAGSATQVVSIPEGATGLVHCEAELVLGVDPVRAALARRPYRLASRGGRRLWSRYRAVSRRSSARRRAISRR